MKGGKRRRETREQGEEEEGEQRDKREQRETRHTHVPVSVNIVRFCLKPADVMNLCVMGVFSPGVLWFSFRQNRTSGLPPSLIKVTSSLHHYGTTPFHYA